MREQEIFARLTDIFRELFDDDAIVLTRATTADDIEDWDSLEHINLIAAAESAFGLRFAMREVSTMKNVGEMVDIILQRGTR